MTPIPTGFTPAPATELQYCKYLSATVPFIHKAFQFYNGKMYEGTEITRTHPLELLIIKTGKVEKKHVIGSEKIFVEGITILKGKNLPAYLGKAMKVYVYDLGN